MHPFDYDKAFPKGAPNKRREKFLLLQINFGKTIELNMGDACGCTEAEWERTVSKRASVCRVRVPTFKRCSHKTVLYVVLVFFASGLHLHSCSSRHGENYLDGILFTYTFPRMVNRSGVAGVSFL